MAKIDQLEPIAPDDAEAQTGTLSSELIDRIEDAVRAKDEDSVRTLVEPLSAADVADVLEGLGADERVGLIQNLGDALDPEVLAELDDAVRDDVLEILRPEELAAAVADLESDDALEVIGDLEPEQLEDLLGRLPEADQVLLRQGLTYPEYTAGRLMQRDLLAIPGFWTVGDTIDFVRITICRMTFTIFLSLIRATHPSVKSR